MNILFFLKPKNSIAYIYDDSSLRQALEKMKHYGYAAIPIIDRTGQYAGTLSEGDLLWSILNLGAFTNVQQENFYMKDILRGRPNTPVNVNASIEDLLQMATNQNFIPVIDDRGLFIGIVTRKDILHYYYNKMHHKQTDILELEESRM